MTENMAPDETLRTVIRREILGLCGTIAVVAAIFLLLFCIFGSVHQ